MSFVPFYFLSASPTGNSLLTCPTSSTPSSSSSTVDALSKFYSPPTTGYISCAATGADQRSVVGFPCNGPATAVGGYGPVGYGSACVEGGLPPAYQAYSAATYAACAGPGAGVPMDTYLKVRPGPYSAVADYPAYFSRLHQVGGGGTRTGSAGATGGQIGYDYGAIG